MVTESPRVERKLLVPQTQSVEPETALLALILENRALRASEEEKRSACNAASERVICLSGALSVEQSKVIELSAQLDAIRLSVFWRMTAPARFLSARWPWLGVSARFLARFIRRFSIGNQHRENTTRTSTSSSSFNSSNELPDSHGVSDSSTTNLSVVNQKMVVSKSPALAIPFCWTSAFPPTCTRIAAVIYLPCERLAIEFRRYLEGIKEKIDLYISTTSVFRGNLIKAAFDGWTKGKIEVRVPRCHSSASVAPTLIAFKDIWSQYAYLLCLNGSQCSDASSLDIRRQFLLEGLIGSGDSAHAIVSLFDEVPQVGLVGVRELELSGRTADWAVDLQRIQKLATLMGFSVDSSAPFSAPAAAMFWARPAALAPLLALEFESAGCDDDGADIGAAPVSDVDRLLYFVSEKAGYRWVEVARPEFHANDLCIASVDSPSALRDWFDSNRYSPSSQCSSAMGSSYAHTGANPSEILVERIQRRALGLDIPLKDREAGKKVVVGLFNDGCLSDRLNRSVEAALVSLRSCSLLADGKVYLSSSDYKPLASYQSNVMIRVIAGPTKVSFAAAHNQLMELAFADGADYYLSLNVDGLLHPGAVSALIAVAAANGNRALVEAINFPRAVSKPYNAFDFETSWITSQCLLISRRSQKLLIGFDEALSMGCENIDISWRARAVGLSLKTCPMAFFSSAKSASGHSAASISSIIGEYLRLAKKWGAPAAVENCLLQQMETSGPLAPPDTASTLLDRLDPVPVRVEWRQYADFNNHPFLS